MAHKLVSHNGTEVVEGPIQNAIDRADELVAEWSYDMPTFSVSIRTADGEIVGEVTKDGYHPYSRP